jgi:hypothetical protein
LLYQTQLANSVTISLVTAVAFLISLAPVFFIGELIKNIGAWQDETLFHIMLGITFIIGVSIIVLGKKNIIQYPLLPNIETNCIKGTYA